MKSISKTLNPCNKSQINIESTLEKIILTPKTILNNQESFWKNEYPYKTTTKWAKINSIPIDHHKFKETLEKLEKQDPSQRNKNQILQLSNKIKKNLPQLLEKGIPHLCSYLPEKTDISSTIFLTCLIPPWAYAWDENIIINLSHKHWNNDPGMILNIIIHELFHIGHSKHWDEYPEEPVTQNEIIESIMHTLYAEGTATYVAYKARSLFSSFTNDPDYDMLENRSDRLMLSRKVNMIFSKCRTVPYEEAKKIIWQEGIKERAFYVVGAYMAKMIDEVAGRTVLIDAIKKGARYFIETYNGLQLNEIKIVY